MGAERCNKAARGSIFEHISPSTSSKYVISLLRIKKSVSDVKQQMNQGYELPSAKPIRGFPRVAEKLASDPDKTTTIFRRFDRLSARSLILQEAELAELEAELDRLDQEDDVSTSGEVRDCHTEWSTFERLATGRDSNGKPTNPGQAAKLELALKIRSKIKEYRKLSPNI